MRKTAVILTLWEPASIWGCVCWCISQFSLTDHPQLLPHRDWDQTNSFCSPSAWLKELKRDIKIKLTPPWHCIKNLLSLIIFCQKLHLKRIHFYLFILRNEPFTFYYASSSKWTKNPWVLWRLFKGKLKASEPVVFFLILSQSQVNTKA